MITIKLPSLLDFISNQYRGPKPIKIIKWVFEFSLSPLDFWWKVLPIYLKPFCFLLYFPLSLLNTITGLCVLCGIILPLYLLVNIPQLIFLSAQWLYYRFSSFQSRQQDKLDRLEALCPGLDISVLLDISSLDELNFFCVDPFNDIGWVKYKFFCIIYGRLCSKTQSYPFPLFHHLLFKAPWNLKKMTESTKPKHFMQKGVFKCIKSSKPKLFMQECFGDGLKLNLLAPGARTLLIDLIQLAIDCDCFLVTETRQAFQRLLEHLRSQEDYLSMIVSAVPPELVPFDVADRIVNEFLFGDRTKPPDNDPPGRAPESDRSEQRTPVGFFP